MPYRVRPTRDLDEFRTALRGITHYFGSVPSEEEAERLSRLLPIDRLHAVFDGSGIVGGAGVFPFELTVPGGPVPCAGVTVVGVLPSHVRRGLLGRMMRAQLNDIRERGEPIAALWASAETIYGRYGYGLASTGTGVAADLHRVGLRVGLPPREGRVRLLEPDESLRLLPRVYERVRKRQVGFLSRSRDWWEHRMLYDPRERRRGGEGLLERVIYEVRGRAEGYALYRVAQEGDGVDWRKTVKVREAFGVDARATREIWRFLLSIDWMDRLEAWHLPPDHPLRLIVARMNLLEAREFDALWVRLVDVGAALTARAYAGDGRVTIEVADDPQLADNVGRWTVEDGVAKRSRRRPDVRLDVQALGAAYLGGFSFAQLARGELVEEVVRGGIARADALFHTAEAPWCPEIF
jgi:predicted acetyltransferase